MASADLSSPKGRKQCPYALLKPCSRTGNGFINLKLEGHLASIPWDTLLLPLVGGGVDGPFFVQPTKYRTPCTHLACAVRISPRGRVQFTLVTIALTVSPLQTILVTESVPGVERKGLLKKREHPPCANPQRVTFASSVTSETGYALHADTCPDHIHRYPYKPPVLRTCLTWQTGTTGPSQLAHCASHPPDSTQLLYGKCCGAVSSAYPEFSLFPHFYALAVG